VRAGKAEIYSILNICPNFTGLFLVGVAQPVRFFFPIIPKILINLPT
jgi:hypothetical protein